MKNALKLKEDGIDLYYHNHHVEFVRYDGEFSAGQYLSAQNAPALGFELGTATGSTAAARTLLSSSRSTPAASRLVHLKDYRIGEMPIPEGGVDFTSKEGMMKFMSNFTNIVQFAEVGEGTLDMPAIIQAGLEGGGEYFLVEQADRLMAVIRSIA